MLRMSYKFGLIIWIGIMMLGYQNCGKHDLLMEDTDLSSMSEYFNYRYKSEPKVFYELTLVNQDSGDVNFNEISLNGFVKSLIADQSQVSYKIEVLDDKNVRLCPLFEDGFVAGQTYVSKQCVFPIDKKIAKIIFEVNNSGEIENYVQNY